MSFDSTLRIVLLNANRVHLNAMSYLAEESARLQLEAQIVIKKPKYVDAEELDCSASCAMAAIICSFAMLESQINELISWCQTSDSELNDVFSDVQLSCIQKATAVPGFSRLETLKKYHEFLRITDKPEFKIDEEPYQSADILRRLRNFVVHLKSKDSKDFIDESAKIKRALESRNIAFHLSRSYAPDTFFNAECAKWSTKTAVMFSEAFIRKIESKSSLENDA